MNINDVLEELYFRVRTTDTISWPFIFETNGSLHIAVVSYLETKQQPFEIYGISRFISYNNNTVNVQNCKQFKKRDRIIIDNPKELVSKEELLQLEKAYFATLEALANNFHSENRQQYIDKFKEAFRDVVPVEYYELYRRACPEFMNMLNL